MNSIYSENLSFVISNTHVGQTFTIRYGESLCEALVLDESKEGKIVLLLLQLESKFDEYKNIWKQSYIRKWLNSNKFLKNFDSEFLNHVKETEVHTEDYVTKDKFWLVSHEEVCFEYANKWFKQNKNTKRFNYFDGSKEKRRRLYVVWPRYWLLRSASSSGSTYVGYVIDDGDVYDYDAYDYGAVLPACLIN
jgi:hypothetical protein